MNANELMVGDWVLINKSPDSPYYKQFGIEDFETDKYQYCEPIPLTREILEKNGFTGGEYKSYTGDVWYLKEEGFRKIGLTMSRKESTLWGEKIKPLSPDSIGYNFAVPNIKFVHELQHALKICEVNKNIIL